MIYPMRSLTAAIVIAASAAAAQDCRSTSDSGATRCVAGVLYRCTCTRGIGATTCTWDNAAALCSALSAHDAPRGDIEAKEEPAPSAAALTP
ncbi:hypothetical protein MSC49_17740 [Methylosinus sp. C49]|uniref:hypothetical protein n=1 Tax=Methylosinus sp. C49 TaxID=2699395 RepID=UPI0013675618|nr:hypothetical protein [Methylosinus sp. C49]BBU61839.1 hypothetical protein MSC49_17740 [Methylosinus sp. C49]